MVAPQDCQQDPIVAEGLNLVKEAPFTLDDPMKLGSSRIKPPIIDNGTLNNPDNQQQGDEGTKSS